MKADIDEKALKIHLEDTGAPYDPSQQPSQDDWEQPLEQRPIGGLGVFLAIQSVDGFSYERVGHRNRHTLTMKRAASVSEE